MSTDSGSAPRYSHRWDRLRVENPEHSAWYAQRWSDLAAAGSDIDGEARLATALVAPGSAVLDAGCGQGRVGGYLSERGYAVAGVDLDDYLISEAIRGFPAAEWRVGDIATFEFMGLAAASPEFGGASGFDAILSVGHVLPFVDPRARAPMLAGFAEALAPGGRLVTGFGSGRGYSFEEYEADLAEAGLAVQHRFSSWDLRRFAPESDFLVCISERAEA